MAEGTSMNRHFLTGLLNTISETGVHDLDLALKVGAVVILIRNLSLADKLFNGAKLIVKSISRL